MQWKKDPNKKYTDLCKWIDENMWKLKNPGEYPEVEDKIYNYLWLLVKALAIKARLLNNFQDYDAYAFYSANRLFFAFRKNLQNQGKTIKGKEIRPIKSSLNYTKKLLYPMKVEFQNEAFAEIASEEFVSKKFDAFSYREKLKTEAEEDQGISEKFSFYLKDTFTKCGYIIDKILKKSPFAPDSLEYGRLKISILLNCLNILKTKKKLDANITTVILWKLPRSMASYVKILLKEFFTALKLEIMNCYQEVQLDDKILEAIITSPEEVAGGNNFNED